MSRSLSALLGLFLCSFLGALDEAPGPAAEAPADPLGISGSLYTRMEALDPGAGWWRSSQSAGFSVTVTKGRLFEASLDGVYHLNAPGENTLDSVVQNFVVRVSPLDSLTLSAGKQRLKWGTAKVFAPLDRLEARANPLDAKAFLPGLTGLKADFLLNEYWSLSALILPEEDLRYSRGALRLEGNWEDLDFSLGGAKYNFRDWSDTLTPTLLDRGALFADWAYFLGNLGVYGEAQVRFGAEKMYFFPGMLSLAKNGSSEDPIFRGAIGLTWSIDLGLSRSLGLFAEYFYNGEGWNSDEARDFGSRYALWKGSGTGALIPAALGTLGEMRRHYSCIGFNSLAITRELQGSFNALTEWESGFWVFQSGLTYQFTQDLWVSGSYNFYHRFYENESGYDVFLSGAHGLNLTFTAVF